MNAIRQTVPRFAPVILASGSYAVNADVHFNLFHYVEMTGEPDNEDILPAKVKELHSKGISPTGKFGFSIPTSQGALIQPDN